jgi:hypothetical protein
VESGHLAGVDAQVGVGGAPDERAEAEIDDAPGAEMFEGAQRTSLARIAPWTVVRSIPSVASYAARRSRSGTAVYPNERARRTPREA